MNQNRRNFLRRASVLGASLVTAKSASAQHQEHQQSKPKTEQQHDHSQHAPSKPAAETPGGETNGRDYIPVIAPDLTKLPFKLENGVKVFHLIAEPVNTEFLPAASWADARKVDAWGYNGSVPGPTIEVMEGDRVKILFTNNLPEPTTPHWHGLEVPVSQDGVPGIGQQLIMPGETYTYEFTIHQNGTYFYHSHMAMQEMMGMIGLFIVHPKTPHEPQVDRDFGLILQGWAILPNNTIPNTLLMEFNWLTMNGKAGPATTPIIVKLGERVRIRMVNLGMDHHPIHLHGHQFYVTGTEGGRVPESAWFPGNTAIVGVAQARDIEFEAKYAGDWMVHCHMPHHMMNQMVSMVGPMMMSHGSGSQTGLGMQEGMGVVRQGNALSEDLGPGFGRGMGMTTQEKNVSNAIGAPVPAQTGVIYTCPMHPEVKSDKEGKCPKCGMTLVKKQVSDVELTEAEKKKVPGYPQDMMMIMDDDVARPET